MIYPKSKEPFSKELFSNPTSEYRGAPFWAWNTKLNKEETVWQTEVFKKMGFGGYFMHVRTGLETPYLGDEFNENVRACIDSSRKLNMLSWLYDEDRWPSGFAGGKVTANKAYRGRYLLFTKVERTEKPVFDEKGRLLEGNKLLARYSVHAFFGRILSYRRLRDDETASGSTWYAYLKVIKPETWHNNQAYVDTMNKEAIDLFADITYGNYAKHFPDAMGKECRAIFTDEPQVYRAKDFPSALSLSFERAWTDDFEVTYREKYDEDILDFLPELFFEPKSGVLSAVRYRYFDHVADRFAEAFCDNLGAKAREVGLEFTGHLMEEPTLLSQTRAVGETMRCYRGFGVPGIDMLCSRYEFTTAKQCQSVVHQYGKEGMLSELYGVSRWNYEFRNYKLHGDWQAALGVTLRVPHLSMMSMKGEAKRDYPASIFYQSPWYEKFGLVEDHFGRVNTALTGGKAVTDIAVIHPVESYWLLWGTCERNMRLKQKTEKRFADLTEWLVKSGLDFDFIDESLLPELNKEGDYPLTVGQMQYKVIVIPSCLTLRQTTVERLEKFVANGGKLIFAGDLPLYMDAALSRRPYELASDASCVNFDKKEILRALEPYRVVGFYDESGKHTDNIVSCLRERDGGLWLFAARAFKERFPDNDVIIRQKLTVKVLGEYSATLYNTLDGTTERLSCEEKDGMTEIEACMYNHDSLLIRLEPGKPERIEKELVSDEQGTPVCDNVPYTLHEPNVLVLDRARFAVDNGKYSCARLNLITLDNICRRRCGYAPHGGSICQPWAQVKKDADHTLRLLFTFTSKIEYRAPELALEDAEKAEITFNGKKVEKVVKGYYVDKSIRKITLPDLKKGKNVLEVVLPFGENTDTENCFLLGNFGVEVKAGKCVVTELAPTLSFGNITKQRLPFYGGKLTYHTAFMGDGRDIAVQVGRFCAPVVEVCANGVTKDIAYAPYVCKIPTVQGENKLDVSAYISRQNAFGAIHNRGTACRDHVDGPSDFRKFAFSAKYVLCPAGVIGVPTVR